jgi:hypothetical protein
MHGMRRLMAGAALVLATQLSWAAPESGWWWNPAQAGRGLFIENQGNTLYLAAFLYTEDGRATWTVATLSATSATQYNGTLQSFGGGQTLTGAWTANTLTAANLGAVRIDEIDARHATLTWPGGVVAIERLALVPGGPTLPRPAGTPETGWWWNPAEPGRGFGIEMRAARCLSVASCTTPSASRSGTCRAQAGHAARWRR